MQSIPVLGLFLFVITTPSMAQDNYDSQSIKIDSVYFLPQDVPLDTIRKESVNNRFLPVSENYQLKGGGWLKFIVINASSIPQSLILEVESSLYFDLIQLYKNENGQIISLGISGDHIHHSQRPIKDHGALFPIDLPPSSATHFLLYASSPMQYQLPLALQTQQSYEKKRSANNMFYTFYYGFISFVLTFTIFLSVIFFKDRIYVFYSLYLLSLLFFFLHLNGFGYKFLWPNWPEFDKRMPYVATNSSMIFLLLFTKQFLRPSQLKKAELTVFTFFIYAYCVSVVLSQFIFTDPLIKKIYLFVFLSFINVGCFVIAWFIAFRIFRAGYKPALFYIIAFLFFFTSVSLYTAGSFFNIRGWLGEHLIQLGNTAEVMVLTLGLAYWFKANQDERQALSERVNRQQKEMADEKDRIMRDLHDSLGGQLSSISIGLNRLNNNHSHDIVHNIQGMADKALSELRNSLWVMSKDSVSMAELEQRINGLFWQYRKIETMIDLQISVEQTLLNVQLPSHKAGHLYRIMQEATHNSVKHSKATHFNIAIERVNEHMKVVIHDNGIGFETIEHPDGEHYGIKNMKVRAEQMGSELKLASSNTGTTLSFEVLGGV